MASKERELARRESSLSGAEQRVASLTRRLETDLRLAGPSQQQQQQLPGSQGFGSAIDASSTRAASAFSDGPSAARQPAQQQQQQREDGSRSSLAASSFATPASSLPLRTSFEPPASAAASSGAAAAGAAVGPRQGLALAQAVQQLQAATDKAASR